MIYIGEYLNTIKDGQIELPFDLINEKQKILYIQDNTSVYVIVHSAELENITEEYGGEVICEELINISKKIQLHKCFLEQLSDSEVVIYGMRDRIEIMSKEYALKLNDSCDEEVLSERISYMLNELDI